MLGLAQASHAAASTSAIAGMTRRRRSVAGSACGAWRGPSRRLWPKAFKNHLVGVLAARRDPRACGRSRSAPASAAHGGPTAAAADVRSCHPIGQELRARRERLPERSAARTFARYRRVGVAPHRRPGRAASAGASMSQRRRSGRDRTTSPRPGRDSRPARRRCAPRAASSPAKPPLSSITSVVRAGDEIAKLAERQHAVGGGLEGDALAAPQPSWRRAGRCRR